jgi:hypothetical protein
MLNLCQVYVESLSHTHTLARFAYLRRAQIIIDNTYLPFCIGTPHTHMTTYICIPILTTHTCIPYTIRSLRFCSYHMSYMYA